MVMDLRLGWENRWSGETAKLHGVWMCGGILGADDERTGDYSVGWGISVGVAGESGLYYIVKAIQHVTSLVAVIS
jgi:hypothetical protein